MRSFRKGRFPTHRCSMLINSLSHVPVTQEEWMLWTDNHILLRIFTVVPLQSLTFNSSSHSSVNCAYKAFSFTGLCIHVFRVAQTLAKPPSNCRPAFLIQEKIQFIHHSAENKSWIFFLTLLSVTDNSHSSSSLESARQSEEVTRRNRSGVHHTLQIWCWLQPGYGVTS